MVFSIVDIIRVLTDSTIPKRYWSDLKIKLKIEGFESYDKIVQLKLKSGDGKEYETDCSDTEGNLGKSRPPIISMPRMIAFSAIKVSNIMVIMK